MKGIMMKGPLVRATLNGNKTMTSRLRDNYNIGETLYIKETFFPAEMTDGSNFAYRADGDIIGCHKWKSAMFMPESASRLKIKIVDKFERDLKDFYQFDCIKEGVFDQDVLAFIGLQSRGEFAPQEIFKMLWEKINGKGSYDQNPRVFSYEFEVLV